MVKQVINNENFEKDRRKWHIKKNHELEAMSLLAFELRRNW
jgi:hypothetical protein